jgi:hypothetical protein
MEAASEAGNQVYAVGLRLWTDRSAEIGFRRGFGYFSCHFSQFSGNPIRAGRISR